MAATAGFGLNAFSAISNAYSQSQAIKAQAAYQKSVAEINSKLADMNAEDALQRGEVEARNYKKQVDQMIGQQRVAFASGNVDVNFGSAKDVQDQTRVQAQRDILTIKSNAFREAWGYKTESINQTAAGQFQQLSGQSQATSTLLTGGMNALSYGLKAYDAYKKR